jgi:hypothetical protein
MLDIQTPAVSEVLTNTEISRLVQAFLKHPDRLAKGATEEDIIKVIEWAHELKLIAELNLAILSEIYRGNILLDMKNNEVVMSMSKFSVPLGLEP